MLWTRNALISGLCLAWMGLVLSPMDSRGQLIEERYATIAVVGEGLARSAPDKAVVRFGIVTRHDDPEEARRSNAEAARRAMNEIRRLIPDESQMRLENLQLQPVREYEPETRRYNESGFEAVRDVVVDVRDLDQLPTIITRVVQAGANRLHSVSYELENQDEVTHLALERALLSAREKAEMMAATLGTSVGRVLRISEQGAGRPIPFMREAAESFALAKDAAAPEPDSYAPGEIEVRAHVEVVFALRSPTGD